MGGDEVAPHVRGVDPVGAVVVERVVGAMVVDVAWLVVVAVEPDVVDHAEVDAHPATTMTDSTDDARIRLTSSNATTDPIASVVARGREGGRSGVLLGSVRVEHPVRPPDDANAPGAALAGTLRQRWWRVAERAARTRPTHVEVESVLRATLAAAIAWLLAVALTDVAAPVLAPLAALITTRASVHATLRHALERSGAVVLGVLAAVAVGDAIGLNVVSIAILCGGSLALTQLVLRMPQQVATQVPVSLLAVMAAGVAGNTGYAWVRVFDTVLGAAVGVVIALVLPSSRFADARDTIRRLSETLVALLGDLGSALADGWSVDQTLQWRRTAAHRPPASRRRDGRGGGRGAEVGTVELPGSSSPRRARGLRGRPAPARAHRDRGLGARPRPRRPRRARRR